MIKWWKGTVGVLLLSGLLCVGGVITAMAATVSDVRITFSYKSSDGEMVEPDVNTGGQTEISDIVWAKSVDKWNPGKKVEATITLTPTGERTFSGSYNKNNCRVSGGTFTSAKKDEEGNLIVKASYLPVVTLGITERAGWSDSAKTRAVWKKVPYATAYQMRLYRDGQHIETITLEGNSIDLSQYMTKEASYYYEVRATAKDRDDSNYIKAGEYVTSVDTVLADLGETDGSWRTYGQGSKYRDVNGNFAVNTWKFILGKWYYFNNDGYVVSGWNFIDNKWYYCESDGAMKTGWIILGEKWYFLEDTGAMKVGWLPAGPSSWYYLNEDGTMAVNTTVDGYVIDDKGICTVQ